MGRASRLRAVTAQTAQTEPAEANGPEVVGQVDAADLAEYREVFGRHKQAHEALNAAQQTFVESQGAVKHVGERIAKKHQMTPEHAMDLETGRITRKPSNA